MSVNYSNSEKQVICTNLIEYKKKVSHLEKLYSEFSQKMSEIFDMPDSLENINEANKIVKEMLSCILADDFTVQSLIGVLSYHYYTHTHSLNTCVYALCLGKKLNFKEDELHDLGVAALLHDLGKTQISQTLLNKNGKLTEAQFKEVQKHSVYGYRLLKNLKVTKKGILKGICNHHEKTDGSGYPDGLTKHQIHPFARIIAICDVFDAITTKKSYKDLSGTFDALMIMKKDMKQHLDSHIVNVFITIFEPKKKI